MDEFKNTDNVNKVYGLSEPPHVHRLLYGDISYQEAREKYPNKTVIGLHDVAAWTWDWFSDYHKISFMPPPIVIDTSSDVPITYDEDGKPNGWTIASCYYSYIKRGVIGVGGIEYPASVNPMYYEVRMYLKNFLREFRTHFDNLITPDLALMYAVHTFLHEFTHFKQVVELYQKMQLTNNDDDNCTMEDWKQAVKANWENIETSGNFADELETELSTIAVLRHIFLDQQYAPAVGTSIKIGGPFHQFMLKRSEKYRAVGLMIEWFIANAHEQFNVSISDKIGQGLVLRKFEIVDELHKITKKQGFKKSAFVFID